MCTDGNKGMIGMQNRNNGGGKARKDWMSYRVFGCVMMWVCTHGCSGYKALKMCGSLIITGFYLVNNSLCK